MMSTYSSDKGASKARRRRAKELMENVTPKVQFKTKGRLEPTSQTEEVALNERVKVYIRSQLSNRRRGLIRLLQKNISTFSEELDSIEGISRQVIEHQPVANPKANPIRQKMQQLRLKRKEAAIMEIKKLLKAKFIQEVKYPSWLENVVMVKKNLGCWLMCVDFTNLNVAHPKDNCPLPSIENLIDKILGCEMLSFIDAYSRYNQIKMKKE